MRRKEAIEAAPLGAVDSCRGGVELRRRITLQILRPQPAARAHAHARALGSRARPTTQHAAWADARCASYRGHAPSSCAGHDQSGRAACTLATHHHSVTSVIRRAGDDPALERVEVRGRKGDTKGHGTYYVRWRRETRTRWLRTSYVSFDPPYSASERYRKSGPTWAHLGNSSQELLGARRRSNGAIADVQALR